MFRTRSRRATSCSKSAFAASIMTASSPPTASIRAPASPTTSRRRERYCAGQRQAEEEQRKLATLVAMNRDAIGIMTMEGRLVYLNQAAMTLFGLASIEEACLRTLFDLVAESDREQARADIGAALNRGYWSGEARIRHLRTGQPIDIEGTLFQIRDDNGAPL